MKEQWVWAFLDEVLGTFDTLDDARDSMDKTFMPDLGREWDEIEEGGIKKGALWLLWPGDRYWTRSHHRLFRVDTVITGQPQLSAKLVAA